MFNVSKLKSESGTALLITMLVSVISTILIGSYMTIVTQENKHSVWQEEKVRASFLAESGVQKAVYYINNPNSSPPEWLDNGKLKNTPLVKEENINNGEYYRITLHSRSEAKYSWLPVNSYLIESTGVIDKSGKDVENSISCIGSRFNGLNVIAALGIHDNSDPENELNNFNSQSWIIDGRDHAANGFLINPVRGVWGIAVANNGDNIQGQLSNGKSKKSDQDKWVDQLKGSDNNGNLYTGPSAIYQDPTMPQNLDTLLEYFKNHPSRVTLSPGTYAGHTTFGGPNPNDYGIFYANLDNGNLHFSGQAEGYGVLVLEGNDEFRITGQFEWDGIVICAKNASIISTGGGNGIHINGALMIANGTADMRGNADLYYSSETIANINAKFNRFQITAWAGKWGIDPTANGYTPN